MFEEQKFGRNEQILQNSMIKLEEKLEIVFNKPPSVELGKHPEKCFSNLYHGHYDPDKNTLYVNPKTTKPVFDNLWDILLFPFYWSFSKPEDIIPHELGHAFNDQVLKSVGSSLKAFVDVPNLEKLAHNLVNEGIAEYFRHECCNSHPKKLRKWPKKFNEGELKFNIMEYGYSLVASVIKKFKVEGIIHMLQNPLTENELTTPYAYQTRIMRNKK